MARKELSSKAKETARQYDNAHFSVIGTKLPREKADSFRNYCKSQGKSVSSVLAEYVNSVLAGIIETTDDQTPNNSQTSQLPSQEIPEPTHPAPCDGEKFRHSDEIPENPSPTRNSLPDSGKSPRARAGVGNSAPPAFPREYAPASAPASAPTPVPAIKNPREKIPPEKSPQENPPAGNTLGELPDCTE